MLSISSAAADSVGIKHLLAVAVVCGPAAGRLRPLIARLNAGRRVGVLTSAFAPDAADGPDSKTLCPSALTIEDPAVAAELAKRVAQIAVAGEIDRLLVECGTEGHPGTLAPMLSVADASTAPLQLTSVVMAIESSTVVESLVHGRAPTPQLSTWLLAEQIEFADTVVLIGSSGDPHTDLARAVVAALNHRALIVDDTSGDIADAVFPEARRSESGPTEDDSNADAVDITDLREPVTGFQYQARRPFHPQRFGDLLKASWNGVFRVRGFFWLATRMDIAGGVDIAGSSKRTAPLGEWWAEIVRRGAAHSECPARIAGEWREPYGDRRQSITVLGISVDEAEWRRRLDQCLLSDEEMAAGETTWTRFADPFAAWGPAPKQQEHAHRHEPGNHNHDCSAHGCSH